MNIIYYCVTSLPDLDENILHTIKCIYLYVHVFYTYFLQLMFCIPWDNIKESLQMDIISFRAEVLLNEFIVTE